MGIGVPDIGTRCTQQCVQYILTQLEARFLEREIYNTFNIDMVYIFRTCLRLRTSILSISGHLVPTPTHHANTILPSRRRTGVRMVFGGT